jgi:pterin-4a-carbinolamine dehydratase
MKNNPKSDSRVRWVLALVAFGIAFGYIEAAVVVYLRGLFYTSGFSFPIADFSKMPGATLFVVTEIGREAATLVLLVSAAWLMARDLRDRLAVFLISFAVWDVFYYVWLKIILNWPASLLDWDILFLIPTTWAGPVLAPLLTSALMCVIAAILLSRIPWRMSSLHQLFLLAAIVAIVICFCVPGRHILGRDYARWFSWPAWILAHLAIVAVVVWSICQSRPRPAVVSVPPAACLLAQSSCVPCQGGVEPLRGDALRNLASQIHADWKIIDDQRIERAFRFPNFQTAMDFAVQVGRLAEQQNHHPDLAVGWGRVTVKIWTHKINGLHQNDFILAAKIDSLQPSPMPAPANRA